MHSTARLHTDALRGWLLLAGLLTLRISAFCLGADVPVSISFIDRDGLTAMGGGPETDLPAAIDGSLSIPSAAPPHGFTEFSENKEEKTEGDGHGRVPAGNYSRLYLAGLDRQCRPGHPAPEVRHPRLYALYHSWKTFLI